MKNSLFLILLSSVNIITVTVDGRSIPENKNDFMNKNHINPRSNYYSSNYWDHKPYHPSNNPWDHKPNHPYNNPWDHKPNHPYNNPWDHKPNHPYNNPWNHKPNHPSNNPWYHKPNHNRKDNRKKSQEEQQAATTTPIQSYALGLGDWFDKLVAEVTAWAGSNGHKGDMAQKISRRLKKPGQLRRGPGRARNV